MGQNFYFYNENEGWKFLIMEWNPADFPKHHVEFTSLIFEFLMYPNTTFENKIHHL